MSLIKLNNRNRLFPWNTERLNDYLGFEHFYSDDFFSQDSLLPAMNVKELEELFEIEFAIPCFDKSGFSVSIENNILTIKGEKEEEKKDDKAPGFVRKEFSYNSFKRSVKLPSFVDSKNEVSATYHDGVLRLELPKIKTNDQETSKKIIKVY